MDLVKILRKRWKVASALFVLTLAATAVALVELPWTYTAQSDVLLLPSTTTSKIVGGNPYLAFEYSLTQTANVLQLQTSDPKTAASLVASGYTAGYTVTMAPAATAPVLQVSVTGSNKAAVENTLSGVTQQVNTELVDNQANVQPVSRITSRVIDYSLNPKRQTSKKARPLLIVFAVGLLLTIAIPAIIDAVSTRRSNRRDNSSARDPEAPRLPVQNGLEQPVGHTRRMSNMDPNDVNFDAPPRRDAYQGEYPDSRDAYQGEYPDRPRRYAEDHGYQGRRGN